MSTKTWFAIQYRRGVRVCPVMNGDTLTDENGNNYKLLSTDPENRKVTVRRTNGEQVTAPATTFEIRFEYEIEA